MAWTIKALRDGEPFNAKARLDSWANLLTGLNTDRDKTTYTLPFMEMLLSPQMLEVMYHSSDIAARVVSALPDEAFKKPCKIVSKAAIARAKVNPNVSAEGDAEKIERGPSPAEKDKKRILDIKAIEQAQTGDEAGMCAALEEDINTLGVREKFHEAHVWGRLYGLGATFMNVDDGGELWMPLDADRARGVEAMTVLDKRDMVPWRWYADIMRPKFGEVALYMIQPMGVYVGIPYAGEMGTVGTLMCHESRLIRFGGELTSKRERLRNQGADYSVLQKCFRALQLVDNNWQSVSVLLADASQGIYKIKGLIDMISQQPTVMQERMTLVDQVKSVTRGIVLDADGEDYERKGTPFSGIGDILDQSWVRLASAARMPKLILMGVGEVGLGDTGNSQIRWWYDGVASEQERNLRPKFEYILKILAIARGLPNPEGFTVVFPPLWQLTEKEIAEVHLTQAQADKTNVETGLYTAEEAAISRFGGGEYSLDTTIDVDARRRVLKLVTQVGEEQAKRDLEMAKQPISESLADEEDPNDPSTFNGDPDAAPAARTDHDKEGNPTPGEVAKQQRAIAKGQTTRQLAERYNQLAKNNGAMTQTPEWQAVTKELKSRGIKSLGALERVLNAH